jgi:hypothetical protein
MPFAGTRLRFYTRLSRKALDDQIRKLMSLKHKKTRLFMAALSIGIFFAANSTIPYGADLQADYQPSQNRVVPGAQVQTGNAAVIARLDFGSREFIAGGARLPGLKGARPGEKSETPGTSASLMLIGLGFMLFGCAVLIRRGKTA